jgi:hypothetical protein
VAGIDIQVAVIELFKDGIFTLSPNVFPNCTFEPEEAPK